MAMSESGLPNYRNFVTRVTNPNDSLKSCTVLLDAEEYIARSDVNVFICLIEWLLKYVAPGNIFVLFKGNDSFNTNIWKDGNINVAKLQQKLKHFRIKQYIQNLLRKKFNQINIKNCVFDVFSQVSGMMRRNNNMVFLTHSFTYDILWWEIPQAIFGVQFGRDDISFQKLYCKSF